MHLPLSQRLIAIALCDIMKVRFEGLELSLDCKLPRKPAVPANFHYPSTESPDPLAKYQTVEAVAAATLAQK